MKRTSNQSDSGHEAVAAADTSEKTTHRVELTIGLLLTVFLILVHFHFYGHAGALWRDEVNSVNYSNLSFPKMWTSNWLESFPILWPTLLKVWMLSGFGNTDESLRLLGLMIGLGILGMLWWTAWRFGVRVPLFSLVFFGLNPTVIIYGDSLRAYGLGIITQLFMLGSVWTVVRHPTVRTIAVAQVAVLLAAHCVYQNCVMILAACLGGAAVGILNKNWYVVLALLSIGFVALISMFEPYLAISHITWGNIAADDYSYTWFAGRFTEALKMSGELMPWLWIATFLAALIACAIPFLAKTSFNSTEQKNLAVFTLVTMLVGIAGTFLFYKTVKMPTEIWYYTSLMVLLAICFDISLQLIVGTSRIAAKIQITALVLISLFSFSNIWWRTSERMTNMDIIAAKLKTVAAPDDLIIVWPWEHGLSFTRYYDGSTPWMTLPDTGKPPHFHDIGYEVLVAKMVRTDPIQPELDRITATLRSGGRVWLVGGLSFLRQGELPGSLPPAPNSPYGWNGNVYLTLWSRQAAFLIQSRVRSLRLELPPLEQPASIYENPPLFVAEGWQETSTESSTSRRSESTSRNSGEKK